MKSSLRLSAVFLLLASPLSMANLASPGMGVVVYDCTAEEVAMFIGKAAFNTLAPSPVTKPGQFTKSYTQQKAEEGDEGCVTIFTDGSLTNEWKETVKMIRDFDLGLPVNNLTMDAAAKIIKKVIEEEVAAALEEITSDVCAFLSTDNFKKMALDEVNKKYGLSMREATLDEFKGEMGDLALEEIDDPRISNLVSKDDTSSMMESTAKDDIKKLRMDMWKGF
jgi:hypothetical protein